MSGISHFLLLGFTISFIKEGIHDAKVTDDDGEGVNGWIVLGFACGGLLFDLISLGVYWYTSKKTSKKEVKDQFLTTTAEDQLTCGINTSMFR